MLHVACYGQKERGEERERERETKHTQSKRDVGYTSALLEARAVCTALTYARNVLRIGCGAKGACARMLFCVFA
jgi:hypothetical protein